jgi:hypothetical protein
LDSSQDHILEWHALNRDQICSSHLSLDAQNEKGGAKDRKPLWPALHWELPWLVMQQTNPGLNAGVFWGSEIDDRIGRAWVEHAVWIAMETSVC